MNDQLDIDINDYLASLVERCETAARHEGWTGDAYEPTAVDLEWVCEQIGRKPTLAEWEDAGLPHVGNAHIAEE